MRILYHVAGFPYPLTSGRLRHYHLIRQLSRRHRVTLVAAVAPEHPAEHDAALAAIADRVATFRSPFMSSRRMIRAVGHVRRRAFGLRDPDISRIVDEVAAEHRLQPFDVFVNAHPGCPVEQVFRDVPIVTDLCDATSLMFRGRLRVTSPRLAPYVAVRLANALLVERRIARSGHPFVVAAARDLAAVERGGGSSPRYGIVIPNGVDASYWSRSGERRPLDTLLFTGAMSYPPNDDAASVLIEQILPAVRRVVPEARAIVAGRDPSDRLRQLADRTPGAVVTGSVDDLRPYFEAATVFVAPLRHASGIQNKVLEALAMGLPVVTTPIVAAGLLDAAGRIPPLTSANDVQSLVDGAVLALERARADPSALGNARAFVERAFSWEAAGDRLESVLDSVARSRSTTATLPP